MFQVRIGAGSPHSKSFYILRFSVLLFCGLVSVPKPQNSRTRNVNCKKLEAWNLILYSYRNVVDGFVMAALNDCVLTVNRASRMAANAAER